MSNPNKLGINAGPGKGDDKDPPISIKLICKLKFRRLTLKPSDTIAEARS